MKLEIAQRLADKYAAILRPYCDRIEIAGSIRRKKAEIKDIELVCIPRRAEVQEGLFATKDSWAGAVHNCGHRLMGDPVRGKYIKVLTPEEVMLDIFTATPENWGSIFLIRTGDSEFSKWFIGNLLPKHGYRQRDGYVWEGEKIVSVPEEGNMFALVGLDFIEPVHRIGTIS